MERIPEHYLILFPKHPVWAPVSLEPLTDQLQAIGLLGKERAPGLYSTGPEYLNLITYLGCSPQVALGENQDATTIRLSGSFNAPRFAHGDNLKQPRCPRCRKPVGHTPAAVGSRHCPHCGHDALPHELDWRRSAAYARVFIEISNVYESEAVPGEKLTDYLQQVTGELWDYCYVWRKSGH
jgi:hypothetical protein